MVGKVGIEPTTTRIQNEYATRLRYFPMCGHRLIDIAASEYTSRSYGGETPSQRYLATLYLVPSEPSCVAYEVSKLNFFNYSNNVGTFSTFFIEYQ